MARLDPQARSELPDRAFAYVDSQGQRRLPIHDAAHVRNALARFGQVSFEDDDARQQARLRLLRAAKKFRIVPIGFIAGQLAGERDASVDPPTQLPAGFVTLLMTDVEGSTALVHRLGADYRALIEGVGALHRRCVVAAGGHEVEVRADEYFAAFESPRAAVDAAIDLHRQLGAASWPDDARVLVRAGIHSGYPTSTVANYVGLDVHIASRICACGHGGQIVVSANTREAVKASAARGVRFTGLGTHRLRGLPEAVELFQISALGLRSRFPALRT